ncbi:hyccin isoform X1 [Lates japonicus]|uniref:Hyccin isoform X1 n=1 Tax=Lates japonicus TaxID=270547 RepID=A0AAD3N6C7_LATJO|nr:hyccin isoform X1 [Lates japonicus]
MSTYAASLKEKGSLVPALYKVIRENYSDLLEPAPSCLSFYRVASLSCSGHAQFLPELCEPPSVSAARDPTPPGCIEKLLLPGMATCSQPSAPWLLTEGALAITLEQGGVQRPAPAERDLHAQNRFEVLTFLLLCYNAALSYMTSTSLQSLCQLSSRVCICGYPRQQMRRYKGISTRLTVTSEFLVQLITGIHYALCNGEVELGSKALDDVSVSSPARVVPRGSTGG